ncbi:MAG: hypothetical protein HKO94_06365 [Flavobacteriaceae bacterium]|nr:hypothetical protein [Flavobacteriaceae bacterium]
MADFKGQAYISKSAGCKMKWFSIVILFLGISGTACGFTPVIDPHDELNTVLTELQEACQKIADKYTYPQQRLWDELNDVSVMLRHAKPVEERLEILIRKDEIREELTRLMQNQQFELSRIRYLKGIEIIKILYEKSISLDHHFSSVITFNEINSLSNPNSYKEFESIKNYIRSNSSKKSGFALSKVLEDNIYTSVFHTFISLFTSTQSTKAEKEKNLNQIECILDFTLSMHNDLNTIYFETAFLKKNNDKILDRLKNLFNGYTEPINYYTSLEQCRNRDDWDALKGKLDDYIENLKVSSAVPGQSFNVHRKTIDLEFPIDQLLQFINEYNSFIDQGTKFYEKFNIMLESYDSKSRCHDQIPYQFSALKSSIQTSIEKFNTAYRPVEVNGSKMKEVLYGVSAFD